MRRPPAGLSAPAGTGLMAPEAAAAAAASAKGDTCADWLEREEVTHTCCGAGCCACCARSAGGRGLPRGMPDSEPECPSPTPSSELLRLLGTVLGVCAPPGGRGLERRPLLALLKLGGADERSACDRSTCMCERRQGRGCQAPVGWSGWECKLGAHATNTTRGAFHSSNWCIVPPGTRAPPFQLCSGTSCNTTAHTWPVFLAALDTSCSSTRGGNSTPSISSEHCTGQGQLEVAWQAGGEACRILPRQRVMQGSQAACDPAGHLPLSTRLPAHLHQLHACVIDVAGHLARPILQPALIHRWRSAPPRHQHRAQQARAVVPPRRARQWCRQQPVDAALGAQLAPVGQNVAAGWCRWGGGVHDELRGWSKRAAGSIAQPPCHPNFSIAGVQPGALNAPVGCGAIHVDQRVPLQAALHRAGLLPRKKGRGCQGPRVHGSILDQFEALQAIIGAALGQHKPGKEQGAAA